MYYVSLNNINLEKNLQIPLDKLKTTNEYLNMLLPNQSISPRYLARKTKITPTIINKLLTELSFRQLIDVQFIVICDNDDPDMIHAFEFVSDIELAKFIRKEEEKCPHCNSNLLASKVRVAFVKKNFENLQGENYG